jgi:hypothetical protein
VPRGSSEDRFGDLGREEPSAAERFAELDEGDMEAERRERERQAPGPPRPGGRYTWVIGVAALIVVTVGMLRTLSNEGEGLRGPEEGEIVPVFAAPLATGDASGDTNIKQTIDDKAQGNETPACAVHGPDVFNLCDLFIERPLVLILSATGAGSDQCEAELAAAVRLERAFPHINFAATVAAGSREDVGKLIDEVGIGFPVAYDRKPPVLFNLYRIAFCSTAFIEQGGELRAFEANNPLTEEELRDRVKQLQER